MKHSTRLRSVLIFAVLIFAGLSASAQARKIDIWDFGGVGTQGPQFANNITRAALDALEQVQAGKFPAGNFAFGDLSINVLANDRLYYFKEDGSVGARGYGTQSYTKFDFGDGYVSNGLYYCNGTGGENRRYIIIEKVVAGDRISFYGRMNNAAEDKVNFVHIDDKGVQDGAQAESAMMNSASTKYEYVAQADGRYKIFTVATAGKPVYYRVVRTPGVLVSGALAMNGQALQPGYGLKFVNRKTNRETVAALKDGGSFSVALAPGYEYTAVLTGAVGFGLGGAGSTLAVSDRDAASGLKEGVRFDVEGKSTYVASGIFTGFDIGYDTRSLKLMLVPPKDSLFQAVAAEIEKPRLGYRAKLEPDVPYAAVISGVNDYRLPGENIINSTKDLTRDIAVDKKPIHSAAGKFLWVDDAGAGEKITLVNVDDGYVYPGEISADGYFANLRDGSYEAKVEAKGYSTSTHLTIAGADIIKDIRMKKTNPPALSLPLERDIYVGYPEASRSYATVKEAVAAAKAMNPKSEAERITIHIAPGVYRAQVIIAVPYLSLVNDDPEEEVKLTWYYGIGYKYFSAGVDGYYDEDRAFDKYDKHIAARWGAATYVRTEGKYFKAKNITFEASFSKYITDEEIADGVVSDGSIAFARKLNSDPVSRAAIERSCAFACEGDYSEFKDCKFIGSQDTLYTGTGAHLYFKNCFIEGNTDYIFGDGESVFDACELHWCGYRDTASGGYIAVNKDTAAYGYLFRNCIITADKDNKQAAGYFGRPWSPGAKVIFLNTKLESAGLLNPAGWYEMSGNKPENAKYREFGTTYDGLPVDTANRTKGTAPSEFRGVEVLKYFGSWFPGFFTADSARIPAFSEEPYLGSDGDLDSPASGNLLTVYYSLGKDDPADASLIRWYRIAADGKETLVRVQAGYMDTSYPIANEDIGCSIKVLVVPEKVYGPKGRGKSAQTKTVAGAAAKKGKTTIFLAGDSTVKDYSAKGMYSGGVTRDEGSWGEYLQAFLGGGAVVANIANGGRSSRSFINDGSLDRISSQIKKGDYLLIQFGHNDCANQAGYLAERYVPLGNPDADGVYPVTAGQKVATPAAFASAYGNTYYPYDSGGTYKWYLSRYIEAARRAGAVPILFTPVSRQYFTAEGRIRPHHDSTDAGSGTQVSSNNAYVTAVRQLAGEQDVPLVDAFEITKGMYEAAYKADPSAANASPLAAQTMFPGDSTHSNKLGGFISAGYLVRALRVMKLDISDKFVRPARVLGENFDGQGVFYIKASGEFTACARDAEGKYSAVSDYWTGIGHALIDEIEPGK